MFRGRLLETGQEIRISVGVALAVLECVAECGEKNRVIAGRARCGPPLCRCSRTPCDPKRHKTSCPKGRLEGFRWPRKCYQLPSRARRCLSESRVAWLIYSLTRTEPAAPVQAQHQNCRGRRRSSRGTDTTTRSCDGSRAETRGNEAWWSGDKRSSREGEGEAVAVVAARGASVTAETAGVSQVDQTKGQCVACCAVKRPLERA